MLDMNQWLTDTLPHAELQGWCKHDLFQFYYDTTNVMGNLADMIGVPTQEDAKQAVSIGACR